MHLHLFDVAECKRPCIPFDVNKIADEEEPFLGFFQSLHLNNRILTAYALREVMLCWSNCLVQGHVLVWCLSL